MYNNSLVNLVIKNRKKVRRIERHNFNQKILGLLLKIAFLHYLKSLFRNASYTFKSYFKNVLNFTQYKIQFRKVFRENSETKDFVATLLLPLLFSDYTPYNH